jgi:probable Rubsico expression protein CbbX
MGSSELPAAAQQQQPEPQACLAANPSNPQEHLDEGGIDLHSAINSAGIETVLEQLERELIGLRPVKARIREIAALLVVNRARQQVGLDTAPPSLHMSFTGRPGTGKTTVAERMSKILHGLGYVRKGHVVTATRDDLVGQYIGHTAPKTREMLKKAMGGVLFIDEAYYLYKPENERDYGAEAIEILLQVMESNRDDLVVIFAGYKERMDIFYQSNPGLSSRVANHIDFPDYSAAELLAIARLILAGENYRFSEEAQLVFADYIHRRMQLPFFANARSIRNAIDRARMRQANRLYNRSGSTVSRLELMTLEADDITVSRVFQGEVEGLDPSTPLTAS